MKKFTLRLVALAILISTTTSSLTAASFTEPVTTSPTTSEPASKPVSETDRKAAQAALDEFHGLSRKERKMRVKEARKAFKQYRAEKKSGKDEDTNTILLVILAILLPPLAVYLKEGEINGRFWLSLILTLLFWIPGVIYALLVVLDAI